MSLYIKLPLERIKKYGANENENFKLTSICKKSNKSQKKIQFFQFSQEKQFKCLEKKNKLKKEKFNQLYHVDRCLRHKRISRLRLHLSLPFF